MRALPNNGRKPCLHGWGAARYRLFSRLAGVYSRWMNRQNTLFRLEQDPLQVVLEAVSRSRMRSGIALFVLLPFSDAARCRALQGVCDANRNAALVFCMTSSAPFSSFGYSAVLCSSPPCTWARRCDHCIGGACQACANSAGRARGLSFILRRHYTCQAHALLPRASGVCISFLLGYGTMPADTPARFTPGGVLTCRSFSFRYRIPTNEQTDA